MDTPLGIDTAPWRTDLEAMHIDHVVLWVEDVPRALAFYTNVVGLAGVRTEEFAAGNAPFPSVRLSDASVLDLVPAIAAPVAARFEKKPTAAGKPLNHVCLAMDRADYDALAARLAAAGVEAVRPGDRNFGARGVSTHFFYFQDPDGNVIEARHYE